MNRLFVYGIFLGEYLRQEYGMTNPKYATVPEFATIGNDIATAVQAPRGYVLTGLIVDVEPEQWERLDRLERGYERITITTVQGDRAYMYAERSRDGQE